MSEEPSELDLHAYVDDQLDAGQRFAVESHLSRNPALAAQVMGELGTRTALRLLAAVEEPSSPRLIRNAQKLDVRPRRSTFWRKAAPAGGLAIAAAISGLLLIPDHPPAYVDLALASHKVAMMRADMASQVEAPALDAQEIQASTQISLPSLPANWRVTDVQLFPGNSGPALLIAIRTQEGERLSLYALRERSAAPDVPNAVRDGGYSVAYWRRGEMSYALTGDDDPVTIDATAEGLNRSWS
jgi:anti-sigma factor RsiW